MKTKLLLTAFLLIITGAVMCAQTAQPEKPAVPDSTFFKKCSADAAALQAQAEDLNKRIDAAKIELERLIGRLNQAAQYANDEKKRLDALKITPQAKAEKK